MPEITNLPDTAPVEVPELERALPVPDRSTILLFFIALYSALKSGYLIVCHKFGDGLASAAFALSEADALERAAAYAERHAHWTDVYHGVALQKEVPPKGSRGKGDGVYAITSVWIDLDYANPVTHREKRLPADRTQALQILEQAGITPSLTVESGHGLHVYCLLAEPLRVEDDDGRKRVERLLKGFQQKIQRVAASLGYKLDSTHDLPRVLRPAGTVNYKDAEHPKLVTFNDSGLRFTVPELEAIVFGGAPEGFAGFAGFVDGSSPAEQSPDGGFAGFAGFVEEPDLKSEPARRFEIGDILRQCAFMRHCREDAAELPEPHWHAMITIASRCEDAARVVHELSRPYPNYTPEETDKKIDAAQRAGGPCCCSTIEGNFGDEYCRECPHRGHIKSPIVLGMVLPSESETDWPELKPLAGSLQAVDPFDPDLLPEPLRAHVMDVAERLQVPPDFPAATLLIALGAVIGRRAVIQPLANDTTWLIVPNLWGGLIGRPGIMKSPVIRLIIRPLTAMQGEALAEHEEAMGAYELEKEGWEARKAEWRKDQAKKGGEPYEEPKPEEPQCLRFIVNDATIEKLHEILKHNPQGVLLLRDELTGWLTSLDTKGRERERPFFLEAWNGDGSFTIDRIGRGTLHVDNVCICVFGGIQPSKLRMYFTDAVKGGHGDDGLAQRLQVLVWPDTSPEWKHIDRPADQKAADQVEAIFRRVAAMPVEANVFRFDAEAQALFNEWRADLERKVRHPETEPVLESHLAKYRKLMPAIALILHLAESGPAERSIPLIQAQRAAAWCEYLESHARRVYSCVKSLPHKLAADLGERLKAGALGTKFRVRDVYTKGWAGLDTAEAVHVAIAVLVDAGWLRRVQITPGRDGGRPTEEYLVNPGVLGG